MRWRWPSDSSVPQRRFEFQMLYGMADPIKEAIQSLGYRVRIYTPYGQLLPGMAYLVRRLLENSSNDSFLRQGFAEGLSEEVLLMNPRTNARASREASAARFGRTPTECNQVGSTPPASAFQNEPLTDFARERTAQRCADGARSRCARSSAAPTRSSSTTSRNRWARRSTASTRRGPARSCRHGRGRDDVEQANAAVAVVPEGVRRLARHAGRRAGRIAPPRWPSSSAQRRFELAAWIVYETGKPWRESDADVAEAIDFCEYYATGDAEARGSRSTATCPARTTATSTSRAASPS